MADMLNPETPTGLPPGALQGALPAEYQSQIDAARRKQLIAQMLFQKGISPEPTQMVGGIAVRQSALGNIAKALAAGYGAYAGNQAEGDIRSAQQGWQNEQLGEMKRLGSMSPQEAIVAGLSSRVPGANAYAKELRKTQEDTAKSGAETLKDIDPRMAMAILRTKSLPGSDYSPPSMADPSVVNLPGLPPGVQTTGVKGEKHVQFPPVGNSQNVEVKLPTKEAETALEMLKTGVKERQGKADAAIATLNSSRTALDALQEGARAGGGEEAKQILRKAAQAIGVNLPDTASTEQLNMALGKGVLDALAQVRPASDRDVLFLKGIQGSIGTDPNALARFMSVANAVALKDLQDYHNYIDTQTANTKTDYGKAFLQGAKIGYNIPETPLGGGEADQLRTMQELKSRGGYLPQFGVGGQPFTEGQKGTKFDIRGPFSPAGGKTVPGANSPKKVTSDADYNALPSGTIFVDPEGKTRKKP